MEKIYGKEFNLIPLVNWVNKLGELSSLKFFHVYISLLTKEPNYLFSLFQIIIFIEVSTTTYLTRVLLPHVKMSYR